MKPILLTLWCSSVLAIGLAAAPEASRFRLATFEADLKEREVKRRAGELVAVVDVQRFWRRQIELAHAGFRAVPNAVAKAAVGLSYDEVFELVETAIHEVLSGLAEEVPL